MITTGQGIDERTGQPISNWGGIDWDNLTLDPDRGSAPAPQYRPNSVNLKAYARDRDGSFVPQGEAYSQGPWARLWRLPTQFLPDEPPKILIPTLPFLVWGLLAWTIVKRFRR